MHVSSDAFLPKPTCKDCADTASGMVLISAGSEPRHLTVCLFWIRESTDIPEACVYKMGIHFGRSAVTEVSQERWRDSHLLGPGQLLLKALQLPAHLRLLRLRLC